MDIATIIGLVVTFGLVLGAILFGSSITAFLDPASMLIVLGGTAGVAFIYYPMGRVLSAVKVAVNAFRYAVPDIVEQNRQLVQFAELARREGVLALEAGLGQIRDPFLRQGLQLLVDGVEADEIETILSDEINGISARHRQGAQIFETLGSVSPALGLVGTLIGLVQMLQSMDDPSNIGPAMAVALLTTFYGALVSTVVCNPIAGKLRFRHEEELLSKELTVKGVMGIARGENPRLLVQALEAELSPSARQSAAA
jgi:chemotaxis protein MotA